MPGDPVSAKKDVYGSSCFLPDSQNTSPFSVMEELQWRDASFKVLAAPSQWSAEERLTPLSRRPPSKLREGRTAAMQPASSVVGPVSVPLEELICVHTGRRTMLVPLDNLELSELDA